MTPTLSLASRTALAATPALLLTASTALGHPGHGAPDVHAHTGSPTLLLVLAIAALSVAALVPLARCVVRRRQR